MNCHCSKPAVVKTVKKSGPNFGKDYFGCELNSCQLFQWVGAAMPASLSARPIQNNSNRNQSISRNDHLTLSKPSLVSISLAIAEFENGCAWFSAVGPIVVKITKFYESFPSDLRRYKDKLRVWQFHFDIYESFVSTLKSSDYSDIVVVQELPSFLSRAISKYMKRCSRMPMNPEPLSLNLEPSLYDTLLPFQVDGIKFVVQHDGRALIADEMGCGKTIQAIGVLQHYRAHWPALLLVPVNLVEQWVNELRVFTGKCFMFVCFSMFPHPNTTTKR